MSGVPAWLGATTGQTGVAGQINQFLGTHPATVLYAATQTAGQTTAGASSTNTNGTYLAQSFSTAGGQTAVGYVILPLSTTTTSGSSLAPTTVSLYANASGAPTGSALVSATVTAEYANLATGGTATNTAFYPLPVTGLTASTTYWIVVASAGTSGNNYTWFRSNQASGASTSANGTTWTAQSYGFKFQVFNQAASGLLTHTWEDSGARWTWNGYGTTNLITKQAEYTTSQGTNQYVQSFRTLSYTSGLLTGVA